jgi:hypothetical protein
MGLLNKTKQAKAIHSGDEEPYFSSKAAREAHSTRQHGRVGVMGERVNDSSDRRLLAEKRRTIP